ncbi:MAG: D-alanine--D-alanine ligase [Patescibacteria group bacterium]
MKKKNIAILFGGKSAEHEVSLISAKNVIRAIDRKKYQPILLGIDKKGKWSLFSEKDFLVNPDDLKKVRLGKPLAEVALLPGSGGNLRILDSGKKMKLDAVFPVMHGTFAEDGTIQGLLKLADVPFVGAGVLGSSVGMDKEIMKRILRDEGLPVGKFLVFRDFEKVDFGEISRKLRLPFFVKPANLGSSVGVSKVEDKRDFKKAIEEAFWFDRKIIIEENIAGREIECAVLGNDAPQASVCGEVIPTRDFYSYEAKYIDEDGAILEMPAKLSKRDEKRVRDLAIRAFRALNCEGLGRVDFFLKKDGQVLVNEINTIPGFTSISMYPKLWELSGIKYADLIDRLIRLAIERFGKEKKLKTSY